MGFEPMKKRFAGAPLRPLGHFAIVKQFPLIRYAGSQDKSLDRQPPSSGTACYRQEVIRAVNRDSNPEVCMLAF